MKTALIVLLLLLSTPALAGPLYLRAEKWECQAGVCSIVNCTEMYCTIDCPEMCKKYGIIAEELVDGTTRDIMTVPLSEDWIRVTKEEAKKLKEVTP